MGNRRRRPAGGVPPGQVRDAARETGEALAAAAQEAAIPARFGQSGDQAPRSLGGDVARGAISLLQADREAGCVLESVSERIAYSTMTGMFIEMPFTAPVTFVVPVLTGLRMPAESILATDSLSDFRPSSWQSEISLPVPSEKLANMFIFLPNLLPLAINISDGVGDNDFMPEAFKATFMIIGSEADRFPSDFRPAAVTVILQGANDGSL